MDFIYFRESASVASLSTEESSIGHTKLGILTLCSTGNTLVSDLVQQSNSEECQNQVDSRVLNLTSSNLSPIVLNISGTENVNSSTNVLDDLGNHPLSNSGT